MTLKDNWQEFQAVLDRHDITKLYHFTDRDNLESIITNGGLYSWADCENKGIDIAKPGGDSQSRSLDRRDDLQNYVRVCFTRQHPMMFVAMNDGRITDPVILEINPVVAYWEGTKYSDRNATKTGVKIGRDLNALKRIHFQSVKADKHFDLDVDEQQFFQAEILVPNCIPLEYITNISDFGIPIPSPPHNAEISEFKIDQDLSTKVTDEDIRNGIKDEFGAIYSPDGKRLLKGANIESYRIREGTIVICNYSSYQMFYHCNMLMSVTIPNSVTKIGDWAFSYCSGLTSITIPDSVTEIGERAFLYCSALSSIHIPNSVTEIGDSAFNGCRGLTSVIIPNSVTEIGGSAFCHCSGLTSVTIPNSVTKIGSSAFEGCYRLTSVKIGNSVTEIGDRAFSGCTELTSVTIGSSVTKIGRDAFNGCGGLKHVLITDIATWCNINFIGLNSNPLSIAHHFYINNNETKDLVIPDSVTKIGDWAFSYCSGLTSITIPDSVTEIGERAFLYCSALSSIHIPNSVKIISSFAFCECSGLMSLTIGKSVTWIGENAFWGCSNVETIIVESENTNYDSRNKCNAIIETSSDTLLFGSNSTIIPDSVTRIGERAFEGCSGLTSITIPDSVTAIGENAFYRSGLTSVTIGNSVTWIGDWAFKGCSGLTSVVWNVKDYDDFSSYIHAPFGGLTGIKTFTFGDEVERIPAYLCYSLSGLTSITIPNSVTRICDNAFYNCINLQKIEITSITAWCNITFENDLYGFSGTPLQYAKKLILNGKELYNIIIPNSISSIKDNAFDGYCGMTSITIPKTIKAIGNYAFRGCKNLSAVQIEDIASWCKIQFKDNPLKNAEHLYLNGNEITDLVIPSTVDEISDNAFEGCIGLTSITIPNSVIEIGGCAFSKCGGLTSITIPNSVTKIGKEAFEGCNNLTTIIVPNGSIEKFKRLLPVKLHNKLLEQ